MKIDATLLEAQSAIESEIYWLVEDARDHLWNVECVHPQEAASIWRATIFDVNPPPSEVLVYADQVGAKQIVGWIGIEGRILGLIVLHDSARISLRPERVEARPLWI